MKTIAIVKWFDKERGHGFCNEFCVIKGDVISSNDVFIHYSDIESQGFKKLNKGELIKCSIVRTERGTHVSAS